MTSSDGVWEPLVWIDCEMTGLDPDHDEILEIYCIVTDGHLRPVVEEEKEDSSGGGPMGWGTVVHQPRSRLDQMDEWCTSHHAASGLTAAVLQSAVTPEQAAEQLLAYIQRHVPQPRVALLAGNSVHADRAFLRKPPYNRVVDHLHYRILDVSSLKEAVRRWAPAAPAAANKKRPSLPEKTGRHRARDDILESIAEARYYKDTFFARPS